MKFIPAPRPGSLQITTLAQVYADYQRLFLDGADFQKDWMTTSGHSIRSFDRHFLHLVKLKRVEEDGSHTAFFPNMQEEKPRICSCDQDFANYVIEERRGLLLPSALDT